MDSAGIKAACLLVLTYLLFPVLILIAIQLVLVYISVLVAAKLFKRSEFKGTLPLEAGLMCSDNYYKGNLEHSFGTFLTTSKPIEIEALKRKLLEIVENEQFSELRFRPGRWMRLLFWKEVKDFNIENHISSSNAKSITEAREEFHQQFLTKGFPKDQPLWEILHFPSCVGENGESAFCLRAHHVLTDGIGFRALLNAFSGETEIWKPIRSTWNEFIKENMMSPCVHYRLLKAFLSDFNKNSWTKEKDTGKGSPGKVVTYSESIALSTVKCAGKKCGARPSEILFTGLAQALKKNGPKEKPETLSAIIAFPREGRATPLTNYAYLSTFRFPLQDIDSSQMITSIRKEYKLKSETAPSLLNSFKFAGLLIQILGFEPKLPSVCSMSVSNVPLSNKGWNMFGAEVTSVEPAMALAHHIPLVVIFTGYKDQITLALRGSADVFSKAELQGLVSSTIQFMECTANLAN